MDLRKKLFGKGNETMKKILSLDLGITSLGYAVLHEIDDNRYKVLDNSVIMRDPPFDVKSGESTQSKRRTFKSMRKLLEKRKRRIKELARVFQKYGLCEFDECLQVQRENKITDKWKLRAEDALQRILSNQELFAILAHMAKHRGYKSIATEDLLYELEREVGIEEVEKKSTKDDERRAVYAALNRVEELKELYPHETIAQVIHRAVKEGRLQSYRNHDNYEKMIRRGDIEKEIETIIIKQCEMGGIKFDSSKCKAFIEDLQEVITDQVMPENDPELFGKCSCYPEEIAAPRYSYLYDLYRLYKTLSDLKINSIPIDEDQKRRIIRYVEDKVAKGKSIKQLTYKDIRQILGLSVDQKIYSKEDYILIKGKKEPRVLVKFFFLSDVSKFSDLVKKVMSRKDHLHIFAQISEALQFHKTPQKAFEVIKSLLERGGIEVDPKEIVMLVKSYKAGTLNLSHKFIIDALPHLLDGKSESEVKEILGIRTSENYSEFPKSLNHLHLGKDNLFEKYIKPPINNHAVKSLASWVLRRVADLSWRYGPFDEIVIESARDALPKSKKSEIEQAMRRKEKEIDKIIEKYKNEFPSIDRKMARKIKLLESQKFMDIYTGKSISISDLFEGKADIEHIVPRSLGGLNAEYNIVIAHKDSNVQKGNRLPLGWLGEDQDFINRVEMLYNEGLIDWKKRKNLLAKSLDDIFNEVKDTKSLRATSYLEALVTQNLKMFYPFPNEKDRASGAAVRNIPGRSTAKARQILGIKSKSRETNWHHAEDALILATLSRGWQNRLHRLLKENYGKSEEELQKLWQAYTPHLEGLPVAEYIKESFERFMSYGEESLWYKDMFGQKRSISFWVSKKPLSASSHKETIYSPKHEVPTLRKSVLGAFEELGIVKDRYKLNAKEFMDRYDKEIRSKLWLHYIGNENDPVIRAIDTRAKEIAQLFDKYAGEDIKTNKELDEQLKMELEKLLKEPIVVDGKLLRKTKFVYNQLNAMRIDRGLVETDKNFKGILITTGKKKLNFQKIHVNNEKEILQKEGMKVFLNEMVYLFNEKKIIHYGCLRSFIEESRGAKKIALFNPRFPANPGAQPKMFSTGSKIKQVGVGSATGIIKVHLDFDGRIKSYEKFGQVPKELEVKFKQESGYGSMENATHH